MQTSSSELLPLETGDERERTMPDEIRFAHTNIVAQDWERLAQFYQEIFDCTPIPPGRDLAGEWLEKATGVPGARVKGIHLRLPGYGDEGPTLEIFQYDPQEERPKMAANRPGFAHIAFAVPDVEARRRAVLEAGGGQVGEVTRQDVTGIGTVTFVYLADPEGNIIEIQRWS
jgi:predicted enzyme related to lactoylglutathione lyase